LIDCENRGCEYGRLSAISDGCLSMISEAEGGAREVETRFGYVEPMNVGEHSERERAKIDHLNLIEDKMIVDKAM